MDNEISKRKKKILEAVVDSYINECEPVSSSTIKDKYLPDVSSATIRSELAMLEDMGFLVQPHISSGRIPSSLAYRYYVDNLIDVDVDNMDIDGIEEKFDTKFKGVEDIVKNTAKVISDVTNYTSIVVLNPLRTLIENVKLVDLGDGSALVIIKTDAGIIRDQLIRLPDELDECNIPTATKMLNNVFSGKTLQEIKDNKTVIDDSLVDFKELFNSVIDVLRRYQEESRDKVYLEGQNKIFEYPEYSDVENVKNFMTVIDKKEELHDLIESDDDIEFSIKIGKDDGDGLSHMALVTAKYSINGREVGHAGVIGPERMDYKKVLKVLSGVSTTLKAMTENTLENKKQDSEDDKHGREED